MQRVVYVEQPFHNRVASFAGASLPVVHLQKRDCQDDSHLHETVYLVQGKEIDESIQSDIENHPKHLRSEIPAICSKGQYAKAGDAAPISGESDQANEDDQGGLQTLPNLITVCDPKHDKSPGEWPHHACLVQKTAVIKRNKGSPAGKVRGCENVRKMGKEGEQE
jgi:hypothetical protein